MPQLKKIILTLILLALRKQQRRQGNTLINHESWLLLPNTSGKLSEKLILVCSHEGTATADYPLMRLREGRRDDHLASQEAYAYLMMLCITCRGLWRYGLARSKQYIHRVSQQHARQAVQATEESRPL